MARKRLHRCLGGWLQALCLAAAATTAQARLPEQPGFSLVDGHDGLPSTEISAMAQDREGYLWLATGDGLARYDGTDFKVWRHQPGDTGALPANAVHALHIDTQDRIWVAAGGRGVSMLDAARQRFVHFRSDSHAQLQDEDVLVIAGRGDETWLGTRGGHLYRIDAHGRLSRMGPGTLPPPTGLHVMAMVAAPDGTLWIGTTAGLLRYDDNGLSRVALPFEGGVFALAWIDGQLWLSGTAGMAFRDAAAQWRRPAWSRRFGTAAGNVVWSIAATGDGEFWLGSERGLWRTRGNAAPVPMLDTQVPLSRRRNVMALLRGKDGALWAPLHGRGLAYLRADWPRIAVLPLPPALGDGVYCPLVPAAAGGFWLIEPQGQLARLDTRSGERQPLSFRLAAFKGMVVSAGVEDARGRLWLGNLLNGLARVDLGTGRYWTWTQAADAPPQYGAPATIAADLRGDIWLAAPATLQRRDGRTGRVLDTFAYGRDPQLPGEQGGPLARGPDGEIWIAGNLGLRAWTPGEQRFIAVPGLPRLPVEAFAMAPDGALWTYRPGVLQRWTLEAGRWWPGRRLAAPEGVPAMEAMDLRADGRGRLWLATRRGLWRVDPSTPAGQGAVRMFGLHDGLGSGEFIRGCLRMDTHGVLAGATVDGNLLLLDTTLPDAPPATPSLRIEEISVVRGGQRVILPPQDKTQLRSTDRQLRVGARLLSFGDAQGIGYRWRMQGLDEQWSATDAVAQREFSALPAGEYTLQVQGVDALGNASPVHPLRFSMPLPWWRSGAGLLLFCLLAVLLALGVAALYRQRLRARHAWQLSQHKRELAEQASRAKSHFLATLGHEVRTPMTGVLGMAELLLQTPLDARQHGYASAIDTAGRHLLRLVNDALDLARIEAGKLSLERRHFLLHALLQHVVALAEPLAARKGLLFRCEIDAMLPPALRGDSSRVQQILLNLLSNAIKFTDQGEVSLRVAPAVPGSGVVFEICDSGPGLSAEQQANLFRRFEQGDVPPGRVREPGSGLGLAICRELATAMGGSIGVDSAPGQGARFRVQLPLPWAGQADVPAARPQADGVALPSLTLLLVEDDPTVAEVVCGLLAARGHQVVHAGHGLGALAELQLQTFDAGLFDLDLPGMDGLALVRQLRALGQRLPVIALTARSDPAAEPQARAAGCVGFLRKPVTGDALTQALAALRPQAGPCRQP